MARSNKPIVWGPFAAGGTLTAFLTPALVLVTLLAPAGLSYESMHAFAAQRAGKLALAVVIGLSLWSAAHRLRITFYDLGVRADRLVACVVYAVALLATAAAILYLLRI
jgi:fumarate reductase subunit D